MLIRSLLKGLFQKAIMQSGCALNPWVNGVSDTGKLLGEHFDLGTSDEGEVLDYLLTLDVSRLYFAQYMLMNVCKSVTLRKTYL